METASHGDTVRVLGEKEFPPSVQNMPKDLDPTAEGILMEHQAEWCALCQKEDLCACEKGRRTGITYATALNETITAASKRSAGGDNVYYVGDTKEKGLEFIGYCAHMAKVMAMKMAEGYQGVELFLFEDQQPDGSSKHITAYRIRFASGFQVVALSSNPANIRGLQGIVIIDEAAFHQNVGEVIKACLALLIWGGKIRIISTHNGVKNAFNQLILDSRAKLQPFVVYRCTFDDAVKNGLFERVCLVKGWKPTPETKAQWIKRIRGGYGTNKDAMKEELDAIPREGSGVALPGVLIERCMKEVRPVIRLALDNDFALKPEEYRESWTDEWINKNLDPLLEKLPPNLDHVFGMDFARHWDFSLISPGYIGPLLTRVVPFLVEMNNVPTREQEHILWHLIDHLPRFRGGAMDATGNGATLAEYTADRYGHGVVHQVSLNDAWYRENMGRFIQAFEDGTIDIPRDTNTRNDLGMLAVIDGITKLPKLKQKDAEDSKLFRHGDAAIGMALMWFASENLSGGPVEYQSLKKQRLKKKRAW